MIKIAGFRIAIATDNVIELLAWARNPQHAASSESSDHATISRYRNAIMYLYHSRAREEGHGLQLVVVKISQSRHISPMLQDLLRRAAHPTVCSSPAGTDRLVAHLTKLLKCRATSIESGIHSKQAYSLVLRSHILSLLLYSAPPRLYNLRSREAGLR